MTPDDVRRPRGPRDPAVPDLPRWRSVDDVEALLRDGGPAFVFKYSSRCSISAYVSEAWREFCAAHPDIPATEVWVIEDREVSDRLAERLAVKHESPQALLVRAGMAVWHTSHARITRKALEAAWRAAADPSQAPASAREAER